MSNETKKYEEVVLLAQKRDRVAQKALFELFAAGMMGVCLRYVKNREEASDLLHDGFIKVFEGIDKFQFQSSLETWMKRVFINLCINHVTRGRNRYRFEELSENTEDEVSDNSDHLLDRMSLDEVMLCIDELPEKYRLTINMYAIDGLSHAEIGKYLNISEGSSKSRLSRARGMLVEIIQQKLKKK